MYPVIRRFVNVDYKLHLVFSVLVRLVLVAYGVHHDEISEVKYTDIDYKVFTDAARHVLKGESPYDRHTYRYTPLVALALIPNVTLHHSFGKLLFCLVDIVVAILIRSIVIKCIEDYEIYKREKVRENSDFSRRLSSVRQRKRPKKITQRLEDKNEAFPREIVNVSMLAWLYNPLTIAVATRGNCDSLAAFLVLLTLYTLQCKRWCFVAGVLHGVSIHFRIYPLIYSLTYFMFLSGYGFYSTQDRRGTKSATNSIDHSGALKNIIAESSSLGGHKIIPYEARERKTIFKKEYLLYFVPNFDQIRLVLGCISSLSFLTWFFYEMYGYKFLYEAYIYHLTRKDTRHNFSLYFYLQYLTAWVKNVGIWQKVLMVLPQVVLLLVFSVRYGLNKISLNFCVLTQTIVMVIYNGVLTSQYFVWVMAVLPICLWQIKIPVKSVILLLVIWFAAQGAWLLPAYLLEFRGQNTFLFVWIQSVSFFCANIAVLGRFIMYFMPVKAKL